MGTAVTSPVPSSVTVGTGDAATAAANTAIVITYAADANAAHVLSGVAWSYSAATPVGGNITVEDGSGNVIFSLDVTAQGPAFIPFTPAKKGTKNRAMIVTLAAGGGTSVGRVSVLGHWTSAE